MQTEKRKSYKDGDSGKYKNSNSSTNKHGMY